LNAFSYWKDPQVLDDMLSYAPGDFSIAIRNALERYFAYEPRVVSRYPKPHPKVGDIHGIVVPQIYADPKPAPPRNTHIVPGPEGTKILHKTVPTLVISTAGRNIVYKVLTMKHKTNHKSPHAQKDLAKDFILMHRAEGNSAAMGPCLGYLNFTGVSDFAWEQKSYIPVAENTYHPRCAPRRYSGKLVDESDYVKLYGFMQEDARRESAGVLEMFHHPAP
jgi:hypothetical protein